MIKLAAPNISDHTIKLVGRVLKSGNLVQGEIVNKLEEKIKNFLGVRHAIIVSSGTAALHLSMMALGIGEYDEVIIPAFTFPATANVVEIVKAKCVLIDISLDDFCIDPFKIENAITKKSKVIMPVHEFGQAADMSPIIKIANKYKLNIVEDAACALGTEYYGKKVGTFGDVGCFSFHPRKTITTGEGGVAVTNSKILARKIRSLRNHGIERTNRKYDLKLVGLNYRMTDFQAKIGLSQLAELDGKNDERMRNAKLYNNELENINSLILPKIFKKRKHVFQTYHVILDKKIDRNKAMATLKKNGIETNFGAYAINYLTYYKKRYHYKTKDFPYASAAYEQGLALPMGDHLKEKEILYICRNLKLLCE
jgi:dTDP-4-amino-4,6-dideoxygalactose transaminase